MSTSRKAPSKKAARRKRATARRDTDPVRVYPDGRIAYWESGIVGTGKRVFERHEPGAVAEDRGVQLRVHLRMVAKLGPRADLALHEAFQDMLNQKRSGESAEGSIRQYRSNWNTWIPDEVALTRCADADITTWTRIFDHANAKGESPRVSWRLGYLEPAPVGTGVST